MRRLAIALICTMCATAAGEAARSYAAGAEVRTMTWERPVEWNPCFDVGWVITEHYSAAPKIRWLQKRHLLPVRKTKVRLPAEPGALCSKTDEVQ